MILRLSTTPHTIAIILNFACLFLTGCVQGTYSVNSLPKQYAARPTSDFSSLNLTAYARPIPSEHEIRNGDRLELVLNTGVGGKEATEEWTVGVDDDGNANLPNIGPIQLVGLTPAQAERTIVQQSVARDVYLTPAVTMKMQERRKNAIVVTGAVQTPGQLQFLEPTLTMADVIVRSGGLTNTATGTITINKASSVWDSGDQLNTVSHTTEHGDSLNINLATTSAAELAALQVTAGATVMFEEAPARTVRVIGVIGNKFIDVPPGRNLRLLDALALAGGQTYSHWISNRVDVIRRIPDKNETIRIRTTIRAAKKNNTDNILLSPNDIVSVEENLATFALSTLGGLSGMSMAARTVTLP